MFTFHTHQQSLCQLVSPKPLVENVVLPQTETKNKRILPFSIKSIPLPEGLLNFNMVVNWKMVHLIKNYSLLILLVKKGFGGKITNKLYFFMRGKAFFSFFHIQISISQNFEFLFHISLWKQLLGGALQK